MQQFQLVVKSEDKTFVDVAKGFQFYSEFLLYSLTGKKLGNVLNMQMQCSSIQPSQAKIDPNSLNEVNLGFFLAAASFFLNFKEGSKQQEDLQPARNCLV